MTITMNYQYAIYPSQEQEAMMLTWLETCRRLYNRCLTCLKDWINSRKCSLDRCSIEKEYVMSADIPFPNYLEQKRQLTQWKKNLILSQRCLFSNYTRCSQENAQYLVSF